MQVGGAFLYFGKWQRYICECNIIFDSFMRTIYYPGIKPS